MTYNRSFQGYFVTGKWTSLVLQLMSLALAVVGFMLAPVDVALSWGAHEMVADGSLLVFLSLLCYIPVAIIVGFVHLFERRTNWLPALFVWLVAVSLLQYGDIVSAFSTFLVSVAVALLLYCQPGGMLERPIYTIFAIVGFSAFILPQFLYLLPLLVIGLLVGNVFSIKRALAALLGVLTPFWLFYGIGYVYPEAGVLFLPLDSWMASAFTVSIAEPTPYRLLVLAMELMVMLPAMVVFASSPLPSKPLLRRRILFIILLHIYLLLFSWLSSDNFGLFYAWRLPAVAIMASYLFTVKQTRAMNIYFLIINVVWLSIAVIGLWLR